MTRSSVTRVFPTRMVPSLSARSGTGSAWIVNVGILFSASMLPVLPTRNQPAIRYSRWLLAIPQHTLCRARLCARSLQPCRDRQFWEHARLLATHCTLQEAQSACRHELPCTFQASLLLG